MIRRPGYRFHEFELYPDGQCLRRADTEIHLRQKVFEVLHFLVENRDRIVSRNELLERCWPDTAVTDDVVFRCIVDIRTALGDDRREPRFIKTVSKAGYRFIAPAEELTGQPPGEAVPEPAMLPAPPLEPQRIRPLPLLGAALIVVLGVVYLTAFGRHKAVDLSQEVGWWRFDEGAGAQIRDATGNGNDGAIVGEAAWIDGRRGKALSFARGAGHVEGQDARRLFPRGSAPRTVTTWMRTPAASPEDVALLFYGRPGYPLTRRFSLFLDETGKAALGSGSQYAAVLRSSSRLADGAWHFVTAIYDGAVTNIARLYVDGALEAVGKLVDVPETADDAKWTLGGSYYSSTRYRGDLDDARLYARALRAAEVQALYRCAIDARDAAAPDGKPAFFLPVFGDILAYPIVEIAQPGSVRHLAKDYAGVQLARSDGDCRMAALRGADIGQDVYMAADVLVPRGDGDSIGYAGPYLRNRAAAPGDGIIGGTSAGYWVVLDSNGMVRVRRLMLHEVVAYSAPIARFDDKQFHRLEIAARGESLQVAVDGVLLTFEQDNAKTSLLSIPPAWETLPTPGRNQGTAGIAFGSHPRHSVGGQQVRNLTVSAYRELAGASQ